MGRIGELNKPSTNIPVTQLRRADEQGASYPPLGVRTLVLEKCFLVMNAGNASG